MREDPLIQAVWEAIRNRASKPAREQLDDLIRRGIVDEKGVVVLKRAKSRAGVRDIYQTEKAADDDARLVRWHAAQHPLLGQLIECVERQRKEENKFHVDPTLLMEVTTASQRSHKSGCDALAPTVGR